MTLSFWSPESLGIPSRQNLILWNDIELAYNFVEAHARYSISGDLQGFLFELVRKRWNLACADLYEPPPQIAQVPGSHSMLEALSQPPSGLELGRVDKLALGKGFLNKFKAFAASAAPIQAGGKTGKLYGYGTDGYGTYIPLHLLWPDFRKYWGIYISEAGVLSLAANLYNQLPIHQLSLLPQDGNHPVEKIIQIAYQVILRHQLFHFKIEQWALLFELATGQAYYLPYLEYVYLPTIYATDDNNLEEALANLSVLLSKKILKLEKEVDQNVKGLIESIFLRQQGFNYRNYDLAKGVPPEVQHINREIRYRKVVNYLCNQIIQHEIRPRAPIVPYYLYPPNNNFLRAENLCPIYLVRNLPNEVGVIA
ncbi:MAG: hypothetical protein NT121_04870 [Chloroflexi bacterium]|nr:hypothetical protein [Chloroflexota bacterium]